jgi:hypothetical protein
MDEHTRKGGRPHERQPGALGLLIHQAVRRVIEVAVEEELTAALGSVKAGDRRHDASRVGVRIAFDGRTYGGV